MAVDTPIRRRMAELIKADKRTQREIASVAGVSQQIVSAITTGERSALRAEVVVRLARAVGLSPTALGKMLYECVGGEL